MPWTEPVYSRLAHSALVSLTLLLVGGGVVEAGEPDSDAETPGQSEDTPPASLRAWKRLHREYLGQYGRNRGISVDGVVTDEKGRPIRGATVGFGPYGLLPFQCNRETDAAGRFRVGIVPNAPGDSTDSLVASADGYAATRIPFAKTPGTYTVNIQLKPGKVFRGRVLDTKGSPVRDAFAVMVARVPDRPRWTVQYRADTDAQGRFSWTGACADDLAVYVGRPSALEKIAIFYHSLATTGRADGKEEILTLRRIGGETEVSPQVRIYEVTACFVEQRGTSEGRFPLYGLCPIRSSFIAPVGAQYPVQHEYGYFGCWYSRDMVPGTFADHLQDPKIPFFLRPRRPDKTTPMDEMDVLCGLPELRRAPPPFDRLGERTPAKPPAAPASPEPSAPARPAPTAPSEPTEQAVAADQEPNAQEAGAVAEVKKMGGSVEIDEKAPGKPVIKVELAKPEVKDAGLECLKGFTQLRELGLYDTGVTGAGMEHLKGLTQLRELSLSGERVTDATLEHLKVLPQLEVLHVTDSRVTGAGLAHLKDLMQLRKLDLSSTQVAGAGLEHLKGLKQLRELDLAFTPVTDAGLKDLAGLTQLQSLDLRYTRVTDACLEHLKALTQLRSLDLNHTRVTGVGLKNLAGLTQLRKLDLFHTRVTGVGMEHLGALAELKSLILWDTPFTDAGLEHVKRLTQLESLNLAGTEITDAGLAHLAGMARLRLLGLSGTDVTDAGVKHLKGLTQLQSLSLDGTRVTDACLEDVKGLTRLESLGLGGTEVTDAGLKNLRGLTQLRDLGLSGTPVTDAGLVHLAGLIQLQSLWLTQDRITDAGLKHLKGLTQLRTLWLYDTSITDAGLEHLKGLTHLRQLHLGTTGVTGAGVKDLQKALPGLSVVR